MVYTTRMRKNNPDSASDIQPTKRPVPVRPRRPKRDDQTMSLFPDVPDRIQVERSVSTIGFFSIKAGVPADGKLERRVHLSRTTDEGRVEATATIAALEAAGGFPGVEDQDVYYAILSAVTETIMLGEEIPVPLSFPPGELLRRMGKSDAGRNYEQLAMQLRRLAGTTVISDKAVYSARTGTYVTSLDMFRVIDRVEIRGERLEDGTILNEHRIYLSSWQIENLKQNHRLQIDYNRYLKLSRPIARAIAPYLQRWLYASHTSGRDSCERIYDQLCEQLGLTVEKVPSRIRAQFGPACQELIDVGFISRWELVKAASLKKRYKLVFYHGSAFDEADAFETAPASPPRRPDDPVSDGELRSFIETLVECGVWDREARKLARGLTREMLDRAMRIIEFSRAKAATGEVTNLAAFASELLRADRLRPVELQGDPRHAPEKRRDPGAAHSKDMASEINSEALAALAALREYERETDELIRSLTASQKAEANAAAFDRMMSECPTAGTWESSVRDRHLEVTMRRIVREKY